MDVRSSIQRFNSLEGSPWTVACGISYTGAALFADSVFRTGVTTPTGWAEAGIAFACDLVDGPTARMMHQSSPKGAAIDVIADKFKKTIAVGAGIHGNFLPKSAAVAVAAVTIANTLITERLLETDPKNSRASNVGKAGEFIQNCAFASYALGEVFADKSPHARVKCRYAGHVLIAAGVGVSALAGRGYNQMAMNNVAS